MSYMDPMAFWMALVFAGLKFVNFSRLYRVPFFQISEISIRVPFNGSTPPKLVGVG